MHHRYILAALLTTGLLVVSCGRGSTPRPGAADTTPTAVTTARDLAFDAVTGDRWIGNYVLQGNPPCIGSAEGVLEIVLDTTEERLSGAARMDDVLVSQADGRCQQVSGPNEYSVEGQFGSTYPDGTRTFELSIRSQEDGSGILILTPGTLHRNGSINGDLFTAGHSAHARVHLEPVQSGLVAGSAPTPSPTLRPSATASPADTTASTLTTRSPIAIEPGDLSLTPERMLEFQRRYIDAATATLQARVLINSTLFVDPSATTFEEFATRLDEAIRAIQIAEETAYDLEDLARDLLIDQLPSDGNEQVDASKDGGRVDRSKPSPNVPLGAEPDAAGCRDKSAQACAQTLIRTSYNDGRALGQAVTLAQRLGASSDSIRRELESLREESQNDAWWNENVWRRLATYGEALAIGTKHTAAVLILVGTAVATGGGTSIAAFGTEALTFTGAQAFSLSLTGTAIMTQVAEDATYLAFGVRDESPTLFQGIRFGSDILTLGLSLPDPKNAINALNNLVVIGSNAESGLPEFLKWWNLAVDVTDGQVTVSAEEPSIIPEQPDQQGTAQNPLASPLATTLTPRVIPSPWHRRMHRCRHSSTRLPQSQSVPQ